MSRPAFASDDRRIAALLAGVTLVLSWLYFLPGPYFLDSFGYVAWIDTWQTTGRLPSSYRYANTLLYYLPVTVFGELGLKVVGVAAASLLAGAYYLMVRRDFSPVAGFGATLLLFTAPTTVITATHLKEDLTSLLCFTIAILLIRSGAGPARMVAAGVCYGLALLFKEVMLGAVPFVVVYVHLRCNEIDNYRDVIAAGALKSSVFRVVALTMGAVAIVLLISPSRISDYTTMASSPYMGQFLGLFSQRQMWGFRFWQEALLYLEPWYVVPVVVLALAPAERSPVRMLYLVMAVVLWLFLSNVTVVRMRHYAPVLFFLAPLVAAGLVVVFDQITELAWLSWWRRSLSNATALLVIGAVSAAQLAYVHPTIDYRLRYPPADGFYGPLAAELPGDALLLGMDNCPIASYESGLSCENRPPDLTPAEAAHFVESVAQRLADRPVYLLPDAFDYDRVGTVRRAFADRLRTEPVYRGWWEPYQTMTYGRTLETAVGCEIVDRAVEPESVSDELVLDRVDWRSKCADGQFRAGRNYLYRGHLVALMQRDVLQLHLP